MPPETNQIQRFGEYAAAFEKAFASDDFSVIEPYFTDDAVYEVRGGEPFAGLHEGRDAVFAHLKQSLDGFDRRFDSRELELAGGPELRDGAVWIGWRGVYRVGDAELVIEGEETAYFEGNRISRLVDDFAPGSSEATLSFFQANADKLRPAD